MYHTCVKKHMEIKWNKIKIQVLCGEKGPTLQTDHIKV